MSPFNKTVLPNGIKVITEEIPYVKSFSLGFWFNVGSRDESQSTNGITHVIEHMLFKGTKKRSAKKIAEEIEGYGGYLNAFTSKEHTCYYARGLGDQLEKAFDIISDMIQNPTFKPVELKKESSVIIDELYDIEDNPEELIFDKFEELLFAGNTLSYPIIGTEKNIRSFSQLDLFNFIKEKYGFNRMIISASGAVDHDKVLKFVDKYFTLNLGSSSIKRKSNPLATIPSRLELIEKEIQQVHGIVGKTTYGYKSDERLKVVLLSQILGEGSSSRLFQSIREKNGIAYQVNSFMNSFNDIYTFGVYLSTNEKMMEKALSIITREFKKLRRTKISERELKKAKESLKGNMILSLENTSNRMIRMAQSELYHNRIIPMDEVLTKIDKLTREDILEIANESLGEDSFLKLIIKSKNAFIKTAA